MQTFNEKLEILITNKASDFEVSKLFKEEIGAYMGSLNERYDKDHGKNFLVSHTRQIESFIVNIYKYVLRDSFGDYMPPTNAIPVALVALGSFGREQLCIYSDLDIMIAFKDVKGYDIKPLMERVLYLAWDAGLKLGHRVHEIEELEAAAKSDDTIKTAMLESRFFFGSKFIWMEIENKLEHIRKTEREAFWEAKLEENRQRLLKYPVSNEPSIKDGFGALREDNTLLWVLKTLHNIRYIKDMTPDPIDDEWYREFRIALEFLFRLRVAMHLVNKKKRDVLLFEMQRDVADKLGFADTKTKTKERFLLKKTLTSLVSIHAFTGYYISRFTETLDFTTMQRIGESLFLDNGTLYYDGGKTETLKHFLEDYLKTDQPCRFHNSMYGYLKKMKIPEKIPPELKKIVARLFYRDDLYPLLLALYETGILEKIFTPFKKVTHLAQFDRYHKSPVDKHSIETIRFLETIGSEYIRSLYEGMDADSRALLKLVALLHDVGKGRIRDHSEVGTVIFKGYAKQLGLRDEAIERGGRLIHYHTLLSNTALREDLHSEKTILSFVSKIGDRLTLDMLYILTYADVNAVGSHVYTSFNADLMHELYKNASLMIDKKELVGEAVKRKRREKHLIADPRFAALPASEQKKILKVESNLFFIKFKPDEILDITAMALTEKDYSFRIENDRRFIIHLVTKKPFNLGWFLSQFVEIDLVSMDIFRLFDRAKYFRMEFHATVDESGIQWRDLIEAAFDMSRKVQYPRPKIAKKEIEIDCDHSLTYAKMNLKTKNQKGLMANVIEVFDEMGIDITTAKISTVKNIARDLFLIEKSAHFCDNYKKIVAKLTE